jgi:class 3 adenylate cyclase/uncharacterized protein HemY
MLFSLEGMAYTLDSLVIYLDQARSNLTALPSSAYVSAYRGMKLAHKLNEPVYLPEAYLLMGESQWHMGNYAEAEVNFSKSYNIAGEMNDMAARAAAIHGEGKVNYRYANYQEALNSFLEAAEIQQQLNDSTALAQTWLSLGILQAELKRYPEAQRHYQDALEIAKDDRTIAYIYNHIGRAYRKDKDYDRARKAHEPSVAMFESLNDTAGIARNYNNMGSIFRREGKFAQALDYFWTSLKMHESRHDQEALADGYNDIAKTYLQMNKFNKALRYGKKGLDIAREAGLRDDERYALDNLARIYERRGEYQIALSTQKEHDQLKDSLINANKLEQLAQLHLHFERKQQLKEIELLKKDKELLKMDQELAGERRRLGLVLGSSIMLFLFGLVGFYYYRYRLRTRSHKVLESKNAELDNEKKKSEALLLNILPAETAKELMSKGYASPRSYQEVTVLFSDFKNFSMLAEKLSPEALVQELDECFQAFDNIIERFGIEKIGDAYMCASGLPQPNDNHAVNMVYAALEMQRFLKKHKEEKQVAGLPYFEARIGIHTGPVVAGVVGSKKFAYDIWSDTVNTASRMESCGAVGEVNISASTWEKVKDYFECNPRGKVQAKGKEEIDMFFVNEKIK